MSKFTFFTILFSLIVIVIVGQLVLRDAIFPQEYKTQVITEEMSVAKDEVVRSEAVKTDVAKPEEVKNEGNVEPLSTTETKQTEFRKILEQSGFVDIKEVSFSGKLFELFDFGTYQPDLTTVFQMNDISAPIGLATEAQMKDEITAQELYSLLQNKTKVYTDLSVNETNSYGDRSFFVNHKKKVDEAFLVVRMKNVIYGIAYVKSYHARIKTLISLLYTAILDSAFAPTSPRLRGASASSPLLPSEDASTPDINSTS